MRPVPVLVPVNPPNLQGWAEGYNVLAQYESDAAIRQVLDEILIQYSKATTDDGSQLISTGSPAIDCARSTRNTAGYHAAMARKQPAVVSRVQGGSSKVQQHSQP